MSENPGIYRVATIGIIVEESASVEALNAVLHDYAAYIVGRMGIPYRHRGISVICTCASPKSAEEFCAAAEKALLEIISTVGTNDS